MPSGPLAKAQSRATMEATRLHRRLGTKFDSPIDVLHIAQKLDLTLMLQPLDNLLGFYIRNPKRAGVVVNSLVPESLQRFTLAHEIGHHVLGHEDTTDDQHAVNRFNPMSVVEVQAQAFASSLLMPVPLVNRALRELPVRENGSPTAEDAYLFSRQLGVSYSAGVWGLYGRNRISLTRARGYIKRGALAAKGAITGTEPIGSARADVWVLNEDHHDLTVLCRVGDEVHLQLREDTSTGLAWRVKTPEWHDSFDVVGTEEELQWDSDGELTLAPARSSEAVASVDDQITHTEHREQSDDNAAHLMLGAFSTVAFPGAGGAREVTLVPTREGSQHVHLELAHPWDRNQPAIREYELDLAVRSRQLAEAGLLLPQRDDWVARHEAIA